MNRGKTEKSGRYHNFAQYIQKCNSDAAKKLFERLNNAADDGNCQGCMWILERRFPDEFGRRVYKKTNVVSQNKNENIEINVNDVDEVRKQILAKFDRVGESNTFLTSLRLNLRR